MAQDLQALENAFIKATEKLKACQSAKNSESCFNCDALFECEIRHDYVKNAFNKMIKGDDSNSEFDF